MDTRRDFIKKAALLSGGTGLAGVLPASIQRALAINPAAGSTFLDAEHVVLLMQENRSFDHCLGTLRGVRGFNDPRAITLPDDNLVWLQSNKKGETYAPFRLDIKDSKVTWMSSLPHSWENQVDARNNGKYDGWLDAKQSGHKDYAHLPLTMGYFTREDIPFYYALADAFTVCDQNFCSSLTGTTPNRLYFWTGTIREKQSTDAAPNVRNAEVDYGVPASWTTFPERLEENGISWKVYQNELSVGVGFSGEEDSWLANFTDNPLEFFSQYKPQFSAAHYQHLQKRILQLTKAVHTLEDKLKSLTGEAAIATSKELDEKKALLLRIREEEAKWRPEHFEKLSDREKNIHRKAFTTNEKDPDYHQLTSLQYQDGDTTRTMQVPKGDVLYQFREDVKTGQLPTVSWIVAPENFSDHPGAPWYGAWYLAEVMDILTQNPEVWKKTVFILAYDENDGDFDHIPPFVPPHGPGTGKVSAGIDTAVEYVTREQELRKKGMTDEDARESPIGLGYRVPLIVASPWSRGGMVCSEVFDHTSVLQFLERFLSHKTGKPIQESNISEWRRTICGDLSSVFQPYNGEQIPVPAFGDKDTFIESIHKAQFKAVPSGFKLLSTQEIAAINNDPANAAYMAKQEPGIKPSCALPYEMYADGRVHKGAFEISFKAGNEMAGKAAAGLPFHVYAPGKYMAADNSRFEKVRTWAYAVKAGDRLTDHWPLQSFENNNYHLRVYGPNGFYREFTGDDKAPGLEVLCDYERKGKVFTGNISLQLKNADSQAVNIEVVDNAYGSPLQKKVLAAGSKTIVVIDLRKSHSWYDFSVRITGHGNFGRRYAGKVENGKAGFSDPAMGRVKSS
ncbi:phosphocholine-specific phospholipase C [Chitinophaga rhizophila]|uniref:phospholipase C n=1 Tax=Chitinophaga rhizophila TaxID=2866212 RepID=A0ABS7GG46_9BACT|nr:phospholipase C, phosphocholine-specific [Chitinophaga rhizophila]MBW8686666.1 phospholipase C, phosphocholine-specific [Chitinophaga rhizophila]